MTVAKYKVRVEHTNLNCFSIVEVEAKDKIEAERKAKEQFQWITGTPPERSKIGYVWIPDEHRK